MSRAPQKRTLQTRARLIEAATEVIATSGYGGMRVEEVVLKAGVAKGTFFSHFADKDALMDQLLGAAMHALLDDMEAANPPADADAFTDALMPLIDFMTAERYVMDVCLRLSGAAGIEQVGPIAETFGRQVEVYAKWIHASGHSFRSDISVDLLAEGVQAFVLQAMAAKFCALHNAICVRDRLAPYLRAWLAPAT